MYLRTRPTSVGSSSLQVQQDGKTVKMLLPKNAEAGLINNQLEHLQFKYDGILPKASQETVYSTCAQEVVDHVLRGYNGTIFAYGQTGAGKTYTMSGDTQSYQQRGIVPRAILSSMAAKSASDSARRKSAGTTSIVGHSCAAQREIAPVRSRAYPTTAK